MTTIMIIIIFFLMMVMDVPLFMTFSRLSRIVRYNADAPVSADAGATSKWNPEQDRRSGISNSPGRIAPRQTPGILCLLLHSRLRLRADVL